MFRCEVDQVSDSAPTPPRASVPANPPLPQPFRFSLKLLGAYAVAIVNGAAIFYILVKILTALRRLLETH